MKKRNMRMPGNTNNYDQLVTDIQEELGASVNVSTAGATRVENAILKATRGLEQSPSVDNASLFDTQANRVSLISRLKTHISSMFGARLTVLTLATTVLCVGVVVFQSGMHSSIEAPTYSSESENALALAMIDETDLTFNELWLAEDAMLFGEQL